MQAIEDRIVVDRLGRARRRRGQPATAYAQPLDGAEDAPPGRGAPRPRQHAGAPERRQQRIGIANVRRPRRTRSPSEFSSRRGVYPAAAVSARPTRATSSGSTYPCPRGRRRLEVVERRHDAGAEEPEHRGRRPPLQVDEDALDGVRAAGARASESTSASDLGIDRDAPQDVLERAALEPARQMSA